MSFVQRFVIPVTSAADGSATAYSPVFTGEIVTIRYIKADYDAGVDFTVTAEATGETIWSESNVNASATRAPRQATHGTDGAAALYAAAGAAVQDKIYLADDRVKIVLAQAGNVKTGTFHIVVH